MRFDLEVTIDRPVADVFAYVSDVRNLPQWQQSADAAEWIEEGKRFSERRSFLGRTAQLELEVTAREENRRFDVRSVSGPVRFEIRHSFADAGDGTRLSVTADAKITGALRLPARMAQGQAERQFKSDLQRLKKILETDTTTEAGA
ncbi:MAG: SRPBCC family protein [Gaiellaceae bacterium]